MDDHKTSPPAQDLRFPDWQSQFRAALLETDLPQLKERLLRAEEAIFRRTQALVNAPNVDAERHAMQDAMRALRVIQVKKLNIPTGRNNRKSKTLLVPSHQNPPRPESRYVEEEGFAGR